MPRYLFMLVFLFLLSGCMEMTVGTEIYKDGSCREHFSFGLDTMLSTQIDKNFDTKSWENGGYKVEHKTEKGVSYVHMTKSYKSLEDMYASDFSPFHQSESEQKMTGRVSGDLKIRNWFFVETMHFTEHFPALGRRQNIFSSLNPLGGNMMGNMFSCKRHLTLPYKVISHNADTLDAAQNILVWQLNEERMRSGCLFEAKCRRINWTNICFFVILIIGFIGYRATKKCSSD